METNHFGRIINHSKSKKRINIAPRVVVVKSKPHVVFFAIKEIRRCAELLYDYGERRSHVVRDMPWLMK